MPGDFFSAGGEIKKEKDAVERNQWQSDVSSHLKLTVQACDLQFQRCEGSQNKNIHPSHI